MKIVHYFLGILCAFCVIFVLLITSVEAVTYWIPGYYEKEYSKYRVTESVSMEMEDLLEVTDEMMAYLRGNREDLHISTIVAGVPREFFNEREIAHMEDVRNLFLAAISLRRFCLGIAAGCVLLLTVLKTQLSRILARSFCIGAGLFLLICGGLSALIATDFTKYFTIFHEIFFSNDLWILNPATDLLINIVPEPFFVDTAAYIALCFGVSILLLFSLSLWVLLRRNRKL